MKKTANNVPRSILKGALSGLVAGMAGAAARAAARRLLPGPAVTPQDEGSGPTPALRRAGALTPWVAGGLVGAAYGVAAEIEPKARSMQGVAFGLTLEKLSGRGILPGLGSGPGGRASASERRFEERQREMAALVAYGVVTELVRRRVRRRLG